MNFLDRKYFYFDHILQSVLLGVYPIDNVSLVQAMAWHQTGDKPLPEPIVTRIMSQCGTTNPLWLISSGPVNQSRQSSPEDSNDIIRSGQAMTWPQTGDNPLTIPQNLYRHYDVTTYQASMKLLWGLWIIEDSLVLISRDPVLWAHRIWSIWIICNYVFIDEDNLFDKSIWCTWPSIK